VACRSQNNPRHTIRDGVPLEAANLGFWRSSCPRRLYWPPRRLDRPVLGSSTSGFPMTVRSSSFVCSTEKSVNSGTVPRPCLRVELAVLAVLVEVASWEAVHCSRDALRS
jgi:hypothetical protein